ncbi:MAG: phosphatidate cytidylyltransferase [Desulfobacteraceae bacterium]|jgi:phosphatidate cytidylyltransferase
MHLKRWLTGIVAIPILIYIIGFGPRWLFCILLLMASLVGLYEFYAFTAATLPRFVRIAGYILTILLFAVFYTRQVLIAPVIIALWAFVPIAFFMLTRPSPNQQWTADMGKSVLGPVYIVLPLALLWMIDLQPNGKLWIFFLLVVSFVNDTGAFYFGRLFGKHKLYEAISPGKTWEGAVGGLLCSVIAALWFLQILRLHPINMMIVALIVSLSIAGQIGDLAESMLKRNHGVKDSGRILPGHGGLLDRIDGLLFSIPVLYLFLNWSMLRGT